MCDTINSLRLSQFAAERWRIHGGLQTYIFEGSLWKLAIPLVLDLGNLTIRFIEMNEDFALHGLLLVDALDDISRLQIHLDRVSSGSHFMV